MKKKESNQMIQQRDNSKVVINSNPQIRTINTGNIFDSCHLCKLEVANSLKNVSPFKNDPNIQIIEHCHFYRTHDSYGKKQTTSNAVNGHYHGITNLREENGVITGDCSAPISNPSSTELLKQDNHIHKVVYISTGEVQLRTVSAEAMKYVSAMQANEA